MNMPVQISLQESDLIFLGHTEVGLLDHMGAVFTMFWRTPVLLSIMAQPVYILTNSAQKFPFFPHPHPLTVFSFLVIVTPTPHIPRCAVSISLWLSFALPWSLVLWSISLYTCGHLTASLEKYPFRIFAHFKIWLSLLLLLSCRNSLYILDINSLSSIWLTNIFSHSTGLFTVLLAPFPVQKLLSLCQSHLFILLFVVCALMLIPKISFPSPTSRSLPPAFF